MTERVRTSYLNGWTDALTTIGREHRAAMERAHLAAMDAGLRPEQDPGALASAATQVIVEDTMIGREIEEFAAFVIDTNPAAAAKVVVNLAAALVIERTGTLPALDLALAQAEATLAEITAAKHRAQLDST